MQYMLRLLTLFCLLVFFQQLQLWHKAYACALLQTRIVRVANGYQYRYVGTPSGSVSSVPTKPKERRPGTHARTPWGQLTIKWYLLRNMTHFGKTYFPLSKQDKTPIFELAGYL